MRHHSEQQRVLLPGSQAVYQVAVQRADPKILW
jgi:hypothetical protein